MQQEQLALFGDDEAVGTGLPFPWPAATAPDPEPETPAEDAGQLTFDDAGAEAA